MNYSFKKTLAKGLKYFLIFVFPFAVDQFVISYSQWAQLSLGALLVMISNFGKHWAGIKFL